MLKCAVCVSFSSKDCLGGQIKLIFVSFTASVGQTDADLDSLVCIVTRLCTEEAFNEIKLFTLILTRKMFILIFLFFVYVFKSVTKLIKGFFSSQRIGEGRTGIESLLQRHCYNK